MLLLGDSGKRDRRKENANAFCALQARQVASAYSVSDYSLPMIPDARCYSRV